jgi:tRNA-2-methylthio-N6-dimethylallyladenosine synthase
MGETTVPSTPDPVQTRETAQAPSSGNGREMLQRRVYVEAFGCQMNFLDGELAVSRLSEHGWTRTADPDDADLVLFNTCSVRDHSENRVWSRLGALRERKQRDPGLLIGVMGCMAQREAEVILRRMPHVDLVCGTRRFQEMHALVERAETEGQVLAVETEGFVDVVRDVRIRPEQHRAYVSVMRGCDHKCSYCIVPRTRGTQVDRAFDDVVDEVRRLADDGVREVTFLGQNINTYGRYLPDRPTLGGLIRAADAVDGIERIRFLTSNPMDIRDELLEAMAETPSAAGYLHFPAQHGHSDVLRRMFRGYSRERYLAVCAKARVLCPGIELASDLIVGFPGETDEEFAATRSLMELVEFKQVYVFKYSPRPGTAAAEKYVDDVTDEEKRDRKNDLLALQEEISARRNQTFVGRDVHVLVDGPSPRNAARLSGRAEGQHMVIFEGLPELQGRFVDVRVERATAAALYGSVVEGSAR